MPGLENWLEAPQFFRFASKPAQHPDCSYGDCDTILWGLPRNLRRRYVDRFSNKQKGR